MFEIYKSIRGPQVVTHFLPGHNLAGTLQQSLQQLERLSTQADLHARSIQLTDARSDLERAETIDAHATLSQQSNPRGATSYHRDRFIRSVPGYDSAIACTGLRAHPEII